MTPLRLSKEYYRCNDHVSTVVRHILYNDVTRLLKVFLQPICDVSNVCEHQIPEKWWPGTAQFLQSLKDVPARLHWMSKQKKGS
ncbi:hypothetical protein Plhal304r1_c016g0059301 [Plasmopara halstedii]